MNKKIIAFSILITILFFVGVGEMERESAEELSIPAGVGIDIEKQGQEEIEYKVSICSYRVLNEKTLSRVTTGIEKSMGQARQNRQLKIARKFLVGLEKVDIISEEHARYGIESFLDILFTNPAANDTALVAICKGEAKDILEYSVPGYPSSPDYIEGMIRNAKYANFFTDNYKILDVFVRIDSEGRNFTLPYLVLTKEGLKIDGLALFKEDKMIGQMGMQEAKILNLLSENSGKGMITIQENTKEYVEFYGKGKRKVKCNKEKDKYNFDISLKLKGEIITNELNKEISEESEEKRKLENIMAEKIKEECNKVLKIMTQDYKADFLELGRVAAAKYGRDTGTDWNETIANSVINVNVEVKIGKQGRGDY